MSKITKRYETKLETAELQNIVAILDAKLEATSPEQVVDYVGLGIENLEAIIARIAIVINDYKSITKQAEEQISIIKSGTSKWLADTGIDKLKGDRIASMKITTPKAKEVLIVTDEEALLNQGFFKTTLDKTAAKKAILDGVKVEGANIEVIHQEETLTVYKKRNATKL